MVTLLAVRDNETRKPVSVEEVDAAQVASLFAQARKQYPPPRYEVVIATAESQDVFLKSYPRFAGGKGKGEGTGDGAAN